MQRFIIRGLITAMFLLPAGMTWGIQFEWYATTNSLYDSDTNTTLLVGGTNLLSGDLVQLIWAGTNGLFSSPNLDGSPGGDDQLAVELDTNNPTWIGSGFPPGQDGRFYVEFDYDNSAWGSRTNYITRFFNDFQANIGVGTYYGESSAINNLPGQGGSWNITASGTLYTDTMLVPEPSAAFLIISGLMGLFAFYRKKR